MLKLLSSVAKFAKDVIQQNCCVFLQMRLITGFALAIHIQTLNIWLCFLIFLNNEQLPANTGKT